MLALTEEVLKDFVRLEFGSLRFVDAPPEKFVALEPSHEARLGKTMFAHVRPNVTLKWCTSSV